ncbi:hypothetical protein K2173_016641 [Erythroxylum novogranatense]|uniref:Uncharacterized protein n=1 Tax=Erythroxylum novogranatense TaxID=1862640 RepID=A0AAV8SSX3_9ROSI|nr:hypothetical protein K2173_016641 [Erythroxylum novogranatense]
MENHHQRTNFRGIFSFPTTPSPDQESDFEFVFFTPHSPSTDPFRNSPADHLFFNGRLLPHSFPLQQSPSTLVLIDSSSRTTSRTSSVSSKDSLLSSRSNSTNSSRSSVSSARTSWSENSERRFLYPTNKAANKTPVAGKFVMAQLCGSSPRWQHLVPVPALRSEDSWRKHVRIPPKKGLNSKKKSDYKEKKRFSGKKEGSSGLFRRIFRSLLVACRECHAMEPSPKKDYKA